MALYNGDKQIHELYNGNEYIEELYNGDVKIFDAGWDVTVSGTSPLTLSDARAKNTTWTIEGESKQGTLPSGYTQLEHLQCDGNSYIDTGINPSNKKIGAVVDFQFTSTSRTTGGVFGSNKNDGTNNCQFTVYNSKWRIKLNSYATYGVTYNTDRHTVRCNMPDGTSLDNTVYTTTQYTIASSNTNNIFVGTCNYDTGSTDLYSLVGKLYSAKVYDDTTLVRNFIPAKNSSNVIGMYDTVSGTFFTNAGTGTFTAGPVAPTPTNPLEIKGVGNSVLPDGYKKLEYIQSSGTQYIDTGITPSNNMELNSIITPTASTIGTLMGSGTGDSDLVVFWNTRSATVFRYITGHYPDKSKDITIANFVDRQLAYKQIITPTTQSAYVDDTLVGSSTYSANGNDVAMFLFGRKFGGSFGSAFYGRVHEISLKKDGTEVLHYIPAERVSDNVIGMYDTVSSAFFTNAGTGDFTAGPEDTSCVVPIIQANNCGMVDLGTLNFNLYNAEKSIFRIGGITDMTVGSNTAYLNGYTQVTSGLTTMADMSFRVYASANALYIRNTNYTDATAFKNAMTGVPIYYQRTEDTSWTTPTITNIYLTAPLNKISTYKDSINSNGTLIRGIGVKVFDGTESWSYLNNAIYANLLYNNIPLVGLCSHFKYSTASVIAEMNDGEFIYNKSSGATNGNLSLKSSSFTDLTTATTWLAAQYAAGTPVTIYYPLATSTTTQIEVPTVSTSRGNNILAVETGIKPSNMSVVYRKRSNS